MRLAAADNHRAAFRQGAKIALLPVKRLGAVGLIVLQRDNRQVALAA
jgi:hypothetical protein